MFTHFSGNLVVCHLVYSFDANDVSAKGFPFKTCFEFAFCFARTKYQNGVCISNV